MIFTEISEFNKQGRGGKGARGYKVTDKTGLIVGTESVTADEEIMLITTEGIIIRTGIENIPILGRTTSGVKLISLDKDTDTKVASFAVVTKSEEDENEDGNEEAETEGEEEPTETVEKEEPEN